MPKDFPPKHDLDLLRLLFVIQEGHLFADEGDRRFKDSSVEAYGPVFGHSASYGLAKIVLEIAGRFSETFHAGGESGKGSLSGGGVCPLVIDVVQPEDRGLD